jgi:predicted nucleic acid-binding protein
VIAYLDSSVLLRIVLGQPGRLQEWSEIEAAVGSRLVEVECLRTLDRLRHRVSIDDATIALRRETVFRLLERVDLVDVDRLVSARAPSPSRPNSARSMRSIWRRRCCGESDSRPMS